MAHMSEDDRRTIMENRRRLLNFVYRRRDPELTAVVERVTTDVSDLVAEHRVLATNFDFLARQLQLPSEERDYEQITNVFYEEGYDPPDY